MGTTSHRQPALRGPRGRGLLLRLAGLWVVAAVLLVSLGGGAASWALGEVLGATVDAALGDSGRFDVLVQVRQDRHAESRAALVSLAEREFPGARVKDGPAAAGSGILLVALPPERRNGAGFEALSDRLSRELPGFSAWVPLVEPSLVVSRLHPAAAPELERLLRGDRDVAYTFDHGSDLVVVLKSPTSVDRVRRRLDAWASRYRVLRVVRTPPGLPAGDSISGIEQVVSRQPGRFRIVDAAPATPGDDAGLARWMARMRDFFLEYATVAHVRGGARLEVGERVRVGPLSAEVVESAPDGALAVVLDDDPLPVELLERPSEVRREDGRAAGTATLSGGRLEIEAALGEAQRLLEEMERLQGGAEKTLQAARTASEELRAALSRLQQAAGDLDRLSQEGSGGGPAQDALVALALNILLGGPSGTPAPDRTSAADLEATLRSLQDEVKRLDEKRLPDLLATIRRLRDSLPALDGQEVASALRLFDRTAGQAVTGQDGVELVLQGEELPRIAAVGEAIRALPGYSRARVYSAPAATAAPSPRASLMQLLDQARAAGGLLVVAALSLWTLFGDGAAAAALTRSYFRGMRHRTRRLVALVADAAAAMAGGGIAWTAGVVVLAGEFWGWLPSVAAAGAAAGWAASHFAERLSPVDEDAVESGIALGLDLPRLLRLVVAPQARPWILSTLIARRPRPAPAAPVEARSSSSPEGVVAAPPGMRRGGAAGEPDPAGDAATAGHGWQEAPAALVAEDLVKRFGRHRVLNGFSIAVPRGETVVLMGPSGCGKSTALRCLAGLIRPDAGRVLVDGHDLWSQREPERRRLMRQVSMVFQRPQLVSHLTVLDNVALGAVARGASWADAREEAWPLLDALGTRTLALKRPGELSGGEGQRVAIARALVTSPGVVLWDEPTSQLDPVLVADLLELMEDLMRHLRTTMLVVTHEPRFARRVAHHLAISEGGRVVEAGPPLQVLECPASEIGRRFARLAAVG